jgi:xanthine dehydrogenase accessory factor
VSDIRPALASALAANEPAALLTVHATVGGAPRGVGAQMLVRQGGEAEGYLAGGCVEADAILHAAEVIETGRAQRLAYGVGGPADLPLACGGRIEVLVEKLSADDAAAKTLAASLTTRAPVLYLTDGERRSCLPLRETLGEEDAGSRAEPFEAWRVYDPPRRLVVVGADPAALALADLAVRSGTETTLVRPRGPETQSPVAGAAYRREAVAEALAAAGLDAWTAVVCCAHDAELDHETLAIALQSDAFHVAALASRRRAPETRARLLDAGLPKAAVERLKTPAGLPLGGQAPGEIAVSILAEMIDIDRQTRSQRRFLKLRHPRARPEGPSAGRAEAAPS